jgi:hydroxymethylpyrimidine pyrophosphatase-like HAD family hydrolase
MLDYILSAHSGVPDFRGMLIRKGRGMHKCSFYFADKAERQYCLETLPKLFPHIKFTSSVPNNIECNSFQADKGLALNALCSFLGIPEASSVAFGDGTNDIAMLKAAGLGVAMANAPDEVKASADITADTNDNAGVGKMILSLIEA